MAGQLWRGIINWFGKQFFGYTDPISRLRSVLDSYGVSYDVNDLVGRWRSSASIIASENALSGFPVDDFIPHGSMGETVLRRDYNYLVTFDVEVQDELTGEMVHEYRSHYSNNDFTTEDWFAEMMNDEEADERYEGYSGELVGISSVVHNQGTPYDRA